MYKKILSGTVLFCVCVCVCLSNLLYLKWMSLECFSIATSSALISRSQTEPTSGRFLRFEQVEMAEVLASLRDSRDVIDKQLCSFDVVPCLFCLT